MATQLTVRIPEDLDEALVRAALRSGLKRSDVVRAALRRFLHESGGDVSARPADLVRDLIGQARRGKEEGGTDSRRALLERIRRHASRPA